MIILMHNDPVPRQQLLKTITDSISKGIPITVPEDEIQQATKRQADALAVLQNEYGINNPNSSQQLADYALTCGDEELLEAVTFRTLNKKTRQYENKISFAADKGLTQLLEIDHPFGAVLNRYKEATGLLKNIKQVTGLIQNGRVYPKVDLQATNRISYKEPPLMNISKDVLWKMIDVRNPGWEIWSVDVRNQEPWIFAHLIQDATLVSIVEEAYLRKESFYKVAFERVYGHPVTNEYEYKEFKTGWNMLTYGGTKQGLIKRCKAIDGAKQYDFYSKLPGYKDYMAKCYAKARKGVTTDISFFGSPVSIGVSRECSSARSLADIPIQGTGADILAFLVNHIEEERADNANLAARLEIYYTRHDEIIFQVKRLAGETDEDIANLLTELTEHSVEDWVPFMTEVEHVK